MNGIDLIHNKLNQSMLNHTVISENLGNINTPNYKRKYVDINDFKNKISIAIKTTQNKHISSSDKNKNLVGEIDSVTRTDNNGVDVDAEMIELNKNKLYYNTLVKFLNSDLSKLRNVITSK